MSAETSAVCKRCGHIGNKIEMDKIKENGFVKGYVHKNCEEEQCRSKTTKTLVYDMLQRGQELPLHKKKGYEW